jgi:hypothetical protein
MNEIGTLQSCWQGFCPGLQDCFAIRDMRPGCPADTDLQLLYDGSGWDDLRPGCFDCLQSAISDCFRDSDQCGDQILALNACKFEHGCEKSQNDEEFQACMRASCSVQTKAVADCGLLECEWPKDCLLTE